MVEKGNMIGTGEQTKGESMKEKARRRDGRERGRE